MSNNTDTFMHAFCHPGTMTVATHHSLIQMLVYDGTGRHLWRGELAQQGLYIAWSRNKIVEEFLKTPVDWLFMVDSDISFPPDAPHRLIDSAKAEKAQIASGLYFSYCDKKDPTRLLPVWYESMSRFITLLNPNGVQRIYACGMGCCIIHRDVLVRMRELYTAEPTNERWFAHDTAVENNIPEAMGEDLTFCMRALSMGYKIIGDGMCRCGHLKVREENIRTFLVQERLNDTEPDKA